MRLPSLLTLLLTATLLTRCNCGADPLPDGGNPPDGGELTDGGEVPDGGDPALCAEGLTQVRVQPASSSHVVTSPPSAIPLQALGTFPSGEREITSRVEWSATRADDSPPGQIFAGSYQPEPGVGGQVTIRAQAPCAQGEGVLELQLEASFQSTDGGTPADYSGPVVTAGAAVPTWVYPSDLTRFPRNIYKVLFQWRTAGHTQFRLTFQGPYSKTVVDTDGLHSQCGAASPSAGCWEADLAAWRAIAGSNAGAEVEVTLEAKTPGDANVYRAPPVRLGFSRRDVRGAIFYWSTTAAGVRRATVSDLQPEAYVVGKPVATVLASPGATVKCVACHTVSRSGRKMVAYTETSASKGLFVYDVTLTPPPVVRLTTELSTAKGFGTFSPDDSKVVATVGDLLKEFDAVTGALHATVVPVGTNPDWSPRGDQLAFSDKGGDMPAGADLEVVSYNGGWGTPTVLVPAGGKTNLFPAYTHDGEYVAYARGAGKHGDVTLQLWLAPARAGAASAPVELINANRVVNNALTDGLFENNMPTWAPEGDLEWVAFNSLRPYGVVFPAGGTQQIWVAAVDRSRLDGGVVDPSYPAFRFAFQDLNENNHRAYWTEDVRIPTGDGGVCTAPGASCDPAASTCCLGTECMPTSEITYACLTVGPGNDGGTCIADGQPCSQTSGSPCCGAAVCDVNSSGSLTCQPPATCGALGDSCGPASGCCPGGQCQNGSALPCDGTTACQCEPELN
ncbi:MAG: hypothetical protein M3Y59_07540 [Myxococcota bacterium]|nr:hypothetical protein [Myxococcota bacterium]